MVSSIDVAGSQLLNAIYTGYAYIRTVGPNIVMVSAASAEQIKISQEHLGQYLTRSGTYKSFRKRNPLKLILSQRQRMWQA